MPRAGLNHERVVALALEVLDAEGWDGMTLGAVAARAGVAVPSLYKHVAGLPGLRRGVAVVCVADFHAALRVAGDDPVALARAARDYGVRHPGRYAAVQGGDWAHGPEAAELDAVSAPVLETIAATLRPLGLPAPAEVDAVRAVRALVHGFVALQAAGGFGLPDDVDARFDRAVQALVAGLTAEWTPGPA